MSAGEENGRAEDRRAVQPADPGGDWEARRQQIIGMGEHSARKSYYPELQQRLDALHESERRFRLMAENIQDGLTIIEGERVTYANERACAIFGYPLAKYVTLSLVELAAPEERPALRRRLLDLAARDARPEELSFWIVRKDGSRRYVHNRFSYFRQGSLVTCYRVTTDMTERQQRQQEQEAIAAMATALRQAETRAEMRAIVLAQCRELLDAAGAALLVPAGEGEGMEVAQAAGRWAHWTEVFQSPVPPAELCPCLKTGRIFVTHDEAGGHCRLHPAWMGEMAGLLCAPLTVREITAGVLMVGRDRPFDDGEQRVLAALTDIAANALYRATLMETLEERVAERTLALQAANERLKDLDRLKSKFVSNVSHELRTPITNIRLYVELLTRQPDAARREQYMETIERESERLARLIEDILILSRLERAAQPFVRTRENVHALLSGVLETSRPQAKLQEQTLTLGPDPAAPAVPVSRQHLTQVLANLVSNALAYGEPGGTIRAATALAEREGQEHVVIYIHNGGPPIPAGDLPHIFERFYRGGNALERAAPGTGLGLAICREIVERHGGTIEMESAPGEGTTVAVWLPVAED